MKRLLAFLLAAMLMIAVVPAAAFAEGAADSNCVRSHDRVAYAAVSRDHDSMPMRKGPGYHYARTGKLKHGDKVYILEVEGKWSHIRISRNGQKGWVRNHYVDGTCHALIHGVHMIVKDAVVYKEGSHYSKILGTLRKGATVRVYRFNHSYALVKGVNNSLKSGWVRIDHINTERVH